MTHRQESAPRRGWALPALTSVLGGFALVAPTMLAVRIVDRPVASAPPVVRHEPAITTQASTTQESPLAGWPAALRLALSVGFLVAEPALDGGA